MDSCLLWVRLCCVIPSLWVKTNGATKPAIRMVLLAIEEDVGWGTVRAYNLNAAVWCDVSIIHLCWLADAKRSVVTADPRPTEVPDDHVYCAPPLVPAACQGLLLLQRRTAGAAE